MFGVLASGRLDLISLAAHPFEIHHVYCEGLGFQTRISQDLIAACNATEHVEGINHIVVFLTGDVPFSEGFGGSIYFGWPSPEGGVAWQLLGFISNQKPSAIFKISNVKPTTSDVNPFGAAMLSSLGTLSSTTALIGISVEPLAQIINQTPASNTQASTVDSFTEFSQKMLQSFLNYASSFAVTPMMMSQMPINPMENYVPLSSVQNWYDTFLRRIQADPNYWKNL